MVLDSRISHVGCGWYRRPDGCASRRWSQKQILESCRNSSASSSPDRLQRHSSFYPEYPLSQLDRVMCQEPLDVSLHPIGRPLAAQVRRSNSSSAVAMSGKLSWRAEGVPRISVPGLARGGESGHPPAPSPRFPRGRIWARG
ncbi:hypothetical protein CORC01_05707 [Colletotrichum orchidophilum]|uniref:Uncharacterized protein n=1 Tax=Colletotrichum orchidophilum TaxID=1209926 RepID=A0A1G4BCC0_9PEZI|nr:uncharacterized protein CORC01_05707 [Colletotrichum orchidophilum]OHE99017.1 hypothetical protein CORC01_05707 [Colletotrichum orchidophilum]